MQLKKREKISEQFECWDIATKKYHNFVANGAIVHNCNAKYTWVQGRMWVGSRTNWKKECDKSVWWQALKQNPWIEEWCKANPRLVLYGEVFGQVQDLKYGTRSGEIRFAVFDILENTGWLSYDEMQEAGHDDTIRYGNCLDFVPEIYRGLFDAEKLEQLSDGPSTILGADNIREGIVIRPVQERVDSKLGRVILKIVSNAYLQKG